MSPVNQRTRVAVLGGGPAALTAAFELTATEELRERHEVTVYQLGWRLGGKGASGRNAKLGNRIEEHGLHIWFGFYDNAFSVMQRCYEELDRRPGSPLATVEEAFEPHYGGVQYERFNGKWIRHYFVLPPNQLTPGEPHHFDFWEVLSRAARFLENEWSRLRTEHRDEVAAAIAMHRPPDVDESRVVQEGQRLGVDMDDWLRAPALRLLHVVRRLAEDNAGERRVADMGERFAQERRQRSLLWLAARWLNAARDWIWKRVVSRRVADDDLRLFFMLLDLTAAMVSGIEKDRLWQRGFGAINEEEFRAWLRRHGASELTLEGCPVVRAVYDAAFCFEDGDVQRPNVAAGKAAQDAIRLPFFYKGAPMYKMQAGMGDTVFGPLYEVLRERGVRFEFFRCVTRLRVSPDRRHVEAIEIVPQADVRGGGEYQPLVDVKGLPCWPSEPDWAQLEDGDALRAGAVDFERDPNPLGRAPVSLQRGQDFDEVVLGIPVGALPPICEELAAANPEFEAMLDNSHTVMTQAFQLWVNRDGPALGFPYPIGTLASCYVEPVDTYCDMSQVLPREDWAPGEDVKLVAYFCGVLPNAAAASQVAGDAHVRSAALEYLRRNIGQLWPAFDWDMLVDPAGRQGEARFDGQYWRANFTDSERYALTLAGSVRYRLWPNESGFDNLALAGDWTRNGIDGGSVEAAVTSGMLASQAICGEPAEVQGTTGWLESDKGDVGEVPVDQPHG
jgi:uncharacterized protein with NAD-binding domain and iron-sulfur cluster